MSKTLLTETYLYVVHVLDSFIETYFNVQNPQLIETYLIAHKYTIFLTETNLNAAHVQDVVKWKPVYLNLTKSKTLLIETYVHIASAKGPLI